MSYSLYGDPVIDATFDRQEVSSANFYNQNKTMNRGLRYYISGDLNSHIKDTVPRATLRWE